MVEDREQENTNGNNMHQAVNQNTNTKTHPNMTAFHIIMLFSVGAALTPAGGSCCSLKQRKKYISIPAQHSLAKPTSCTCHYQQYGLLRLKVVNVTEID